ncbi:hypothetical protein MC7420_3905 [Coleofasciculus chthonoplastes PCC 7420]|uniref:Uncharacterized protein n=1 Tax=Coleofasciculus chthonoplastes PCC 7420 TaxID=118168 RepID=B4VUD3_9CYAN|nr:hypothetical protein MC7420_3905 [Coleofasciculus chthonoplastes PCC 7420]
MQQAFFELFYTLNLLPHCFNIKRFHENTKLYKDYVRRVAV